MEIAPTAILYTCWLRPSGMQVEQIATPLSLPGLTRQSIHLRKNLFAKKMDARVKPAHDELGKLPSVSFCTIPFLFRRAFARGVMSFASLTPNRGVGGAPRDVRVQRHPFGLPSCVKDARERACDAAGQALARRLASH